MPRGGGGGFRGGGGGFRRTPRGASHPPFSYRSGVAVGTDLSGTQGHALVAMLMARDDGDLHTFRAGGHTWHLVLDPGGVHQSGLRRVDDLRRSHSLAFMDGFVKMEDIEATVHPMAASSATTKPYIR